MCFFVCVIIPSRTFHDGIFFRANFSLFMRFNGENSLHIPKTKKDFLLMMIVSQHWFLQFPSNFLNFLCCRRSWC